MKKYSGKAGFAVGTGRCGTTFLAEVMKHEPGVASVHERDWFNETFHLYCQWNNLSVDHAAFLTRKEMEIRSDLAQYSFSFEASHYLSHSIEVLYQGLGTKFVLVVRSPEKVINSFLQRGWYQQPAIRKDPNLAIGYHDWQSPGYPYASFYRIVPNGEKFTQWNTMSRVGKLAWYWNTRNQIILDQFRRIPEGNWMVQKLEELDFERYQAITSFLGFHSQLTEEAYNAIANQRPNQNKKGKVVTVADWTEEQLLEFKEEVMPMSNYFGYNIDFQPEPKSLAAIH